MIARDSTGAWRAWLYIFILAAVIVLTASGLMLRSVFRRGAKSRNTPNG
jgi:hypothetical protein